MLDKGLEQDRRRKCYGKYEPFDSDKQARRGCRDCLAEEECRKLERQAENTRRQAEWDAKTLEEKAQFEAMIKGVKELY